MRHLRSSAGWMEGGRSSTLSTEGLGATSDRAEAMSSSMVGRSLLPSAPTCSQETRWRFACRV